MNPTNAPAEDFSEIDRAIGEMASSGSVEVHEDGEWLAELVGLHCEFRQQGRSSLVHLWSDERNLTRRVLRVKERTAERIVLEVRRFGRAKPGRLEFLRTDSPRSAGRITREQFRARFHRILAERFPDAVVDGLSASPDLEHSLSGIYVRGRMQEAAQSWAFLAASPAESAAAIDGILAFGLIWLDWTRSHSDRRAIEGLRLFVPQGTSGRIRERALALSSAARTEIFEYTVPDAKMQKMDPADAGNLESRLIPRREIESALHAADHAISRIRSLVPRASEAMQTRVPPGTSEVALNFRGLDFARWTKDGVFFGLREARHSLTQANENELEQLIRQLDLHRSSLATEKNRSLYRAVPERWLEFLALEDVTLINAQLDAEHVYAQVPALAGGDRGVLDLLAATRRGRLVVIELKATEDIQMPMQAVDYWLRIRRHQREGDFQRGGYFAGIELDPQPPLVWLVAPGLRFHPATDTLLKYLAPEIHVTRIGLNENWRRGLKVVFRQ
ncbi:MAG TPA: hypothetical protein VEG64_15535 [Candidatus Sulfotelmatobacter sp.]|nr:hypothetical protein [Candidatus Sulfotelmatobacter sp.]